MTVKDERQAGWTAERRAKQAATVAAWTDEQRQANSAALSAGKIGNKNALGKHWTLTPETRARQSAGLKGKAKSEAHRQALRGPKSEVHRAKIAASHVGLKNSDESRRKQSESTRGVKKSLAHRTAMSAAHKLRYAENPEIRARQVEIVLKAGQTLGGKRIEYTDRIGRVWSMRSGWEVEFAVALDRAKRIWWYELDRLKLSNGSVYVPDFFVAGIGHVEVKGWMRPRGQEKLDQAREDGYKVTLVQGRTELDRIIAELEAA